MTSANAARTRAVGLVLLASSLAGCGQQSGPLVGLLDHRSSAPSKLSDVFSPCTRQVAAPGTTHLRPVPTIAANNDKDPVGQAIPHGSVTLEHAADLVLDDGRLGAGDGGDAAFGGTTKVKVASGPTTAPVTLAVLNSPASGRRVAFVEVQIKATPPVRWEASTAMAISTDGGDGGFERGSAGTIPGDSDADIDAYVNGFDDKADGVCALRAAPKGGVDAVLFSTGYGDGGYPTYIGRDAAGEIVSVVNFGYVLPWRDGGLPGLMPKAIDPSNAAGS